MPVRHVVAVSLLAVKARSHAAMTIPMPRNNVKQEQPSADNGYGGGCLGNSCQWWSAGCHIGCDACSMTHAGSLIPSYPSDNGCDNPMEPTLDHSLRTYNVYDQSTYGDWSYWNPWRAPGFAPLASSCGAAGAYGDYPDDTGGGNPVDGYPVLTWGTWLPETNPSRWYAGDVVEVAWQIRANHGGGYQYRVCPKWHDLGEDCFQAHVLPFVSDKTVIRYLDGSRGDFQIDAMDATEGTWPEGSAWRRNPIPNCIIGVEGPDHPEEPGFAFGDYTSHANCPEGCTFEPAWDEGCGSNSWAGQLPFQIVDYVQLPMTPGDYVLSWRWDCEQTSQVWANCADITINPTEYNTNAIAMKDLSAKCIDLPGGDTTNGNFVWIWDCNMASGQQWTFNADSWTINYSLDPSKCLDLPGGDASNGNRLWIWDCNGSPGQGWGFDYNGASIFSTVDSNKCLDLAGNNNNNGSPLWIWDCDSFNPDMAGQRWIPPSAEVLMIGDKCLDLPGTDATNGQKVQTWDCNGVLNQAWAWASSSSGHQIRFGPNMMKCLDLSGGDDTNGNQLQVWDCNDSWQQGWGFDSHTGALYLASSTSADATKCVDAGNYDGDNRAVYIWDCNGSGQQSWAKGPFQFSAYLKKAVMKELAQNGTDLNGPVILV